VVCLWCVCVCETSVCGMCGVFVCLWCVCDVCDDVILVYDLYTRS